MQAEQVGHVRSRDGTPIAFWRGGDGPPLVLVHGTSGNHLSFRFVQPLLEEHFAVYAIDRRGRVGSGDAAEYAIEREFEDLAALVDSLSEPAGLLGHSSGATCALGAAPLACNLRALVLYEPAPGIPSVPAGAIERVEELLHHGDREQAMTFFFREVLELSEEDLAQFRASPTWPMRVAAAHTVPRELRAEEGYRPDPERFRSVREPALLVLGGESPAWARQGTELAGALLLDARVAVLPGQGHLAIVTAPELFATEVVRFLQAG
jgi:pimeloyl-ACP methyl ester carboxylesterase